MKLKSGQIIPNSSIVEIYEAFCQVRRGPDGRKYHMVVECYSDTAHRWRYVGNGVPVTCLDATVRKYRDKAYLVFNRYNMSDDYSKVTGLKDRYCLTPAVMELMGWTI